jgi:nondiscriminating aspartyl-tRNA synthetase
MNTEENYYLELSKGMTPIETSNSSHVYCEEYKIENKRVKFFWGIYEDSTPEDEPIFFEAEDWVEPVLERSLINELGESFKAKIGSKVLLKGWVSQWRELKKMSFLILRDRTGYCQIVVPKHLASSLLSETVVEIIGVVNKHEESRYNQIEIFAESLTVVSETAVLPFPISREENAPPFNTINIFRPITLRREKERCIFKIQSEITYAYREYLRSQGFTEINSTKLSAAGLEGGSEMFALDYFGKEMFLTQSPQFYKQMMVGVYERVFEINKVYRAEGSNTNKHLAEFIGLDLEMGFINSVDEIMDMEENMFNYVFRHIHKVCSKELEHLGVSLEDYSTGMERFPRLTYKETIEILEKEFGCKLHGTGLTTEAERLISQYVFSTYSSEFVFITKYPLSERPFYAMPSVEEGCSETFELLYKGMEITSGGQRIHNYSQLVSSIEAKGMNPERFESYLMPFKYGMPPHGGFGIGLERVMKQMLNLNSAEEASLIPRTGEKFIH